MMTNMEEQRTLTWGATPVVCQWGKFYKNHRGLQIHQNHKSGCQICALATHIFIWWDGGDYYSGQQASGLLAPVCWRSDGRSAKDHYPFQYVGSLRVGLRRTIIHSSVLEVWRSVCEGPLSIPVCWKSEGRSAKDHYPFQYVGGMMVGLRRTIIHSSMLEIWGSVCEGPLSIPESWLTSTVEQLTANPVEERL